MSLHMVPFMLNDDRAETHFRIHIEIISLQFDVVHFLSDDCCGNFIEDKEKGQLL